MGETTSASYAIQPEVAPPPHAQQSSPKPQGMSLAGKGHNTALWPMAPRRFTSQLFWSAGRYLLRTTQYRIQSTSRQAPHYPQHLRRHRQVSTNSKGYCHEKPSKEEHEDKVSRPSTEGAFF